MHTPSSLIHQRYHTMINKVLSATDLSATGHVTRISGLILEAVGFKAPIGSICAVRTLDKSLEAEVIGFDDKKIFLMTTHSTRGLTPGAEVIPQHRIPSVAVGDALLGRVIDGAGVPLDDKGLVSAEQHYPLLVEPINPLHRHAITTSLDVGVRAINALYSVGRGQRMGLFAGSGVGKSMLLGMMTRFTQADVVVVGLIGERGREVKEFIEMILGASGLKRSVVVAAPADTSPLMRIHGAQRATSIAEYFRDQGLNVLLLMDSLTRFAHAYRELALSLGEAPVTKGYPPSVFAKLSQLIERTGNGKVGQGSITAFYTVLMEGDDQQEPIADAARSHLDGHIVLSRALADSGHYPAIDTESSISRVMPLITDPLHLQKTQQFKHLYSHYQSNKDLISIGAYQSGSDPELEIAIKKMPRMNQFLQQSFSEQADFSSSINALNEVFNDD